MLFASFLFLATCEVAQANGLDYRAGSSGCAFNRNALFKKSSDGGVDDPSSIANDCFAKIFNQTCARNR